jgi:hypothetical protein
MRLDRQINLIPTPINLFFLLTNYISHGFSDFARRRAPSQKQEYKYKYFTFIHDYRRLYCRSLSWLVHRLLPYRVRCHLNEKRVAHPGLWVVAIVWSISLYVLSLFTTIRATLHEYGHMMDPLIIWWDMICNFQHVFDVYVDAYYYTMSLCRSSDQTSIL